MSFMTQVRQVFVRDARAARWMLFLLAGLCMSAVLQGQRLVDPPAIDAIGRPPALTLPPEWISSVVTMLVLVALGGVIALAFAPRVANATTSDWRALPIATTAVWSARLLWIALLFLTVICVTWIVLAALALHDVVAFRVSASVALGAAMLFVAGALFAVAAGSVRRFAVWSLATPVVLVLVALLLTVLSNVWPTLSLPVERPAVSTGHAVFVLGAALGVLAVLLRARRVTGPARTVAAATAIVLLLANAVTAPRVPRPTPSDALPTLVTNARLEASLERNPIAAAQLRVSSLPASRREGEPVMPPQDGAGMGSDVAASPDFLIEPRGPSPEGTWVKLDARFDPVNDEARLVWRGRHLAATEPVGSASRPFRLSGAQVVLSPGTPTLAPAVRWLNAPPVRPPSVLSFVSGPAGRTLQAPDARARLTVDLERQASSLLALVPLHDGEASGPWRDQVRVTARPEDEADAAVWASVVLIRERGSERHVIAGLADDLTFALVHQARGEAVHLESNTRGGSDRGWGFAPSLIGLMRVRLAPPMRYVASPTDSTQRVLVPPPDAEWMRGASLAVFGWRTVERGALVLEAPVTVRTASR